MPTFGIHAFVWNGDWNNEIASVTIPQTEAAGFDLLEIPLLRPQECDAPRIKRLLNDHHLKASVSLGLPKPLHLPSNPHGALSFLKLALDKAEQFGAIMLTGCLYCNLGTMTGQPPTAAERQLCVDVLGEIARDAKTRGIRVGIEPVNRYETYLYNVGADAADLIKATGADNMFVHFDTYHMNIEENGFSKSIIAAGSLCGYIHLSESNRGVPGEGNVNWDDTFAGLKAIGYTGPLVMEAFAAINDDLRGATCLWRPGIYSGEELATRGLAFLRGKTEAYGLA